MFSLRHDETSKMFFLQQGEEIQMPILEDEPQNQTGLEEPQVATGPVCSHCGHPMKTAEASVCHKCGYYAKIGAFMDIDPDWEREHGEEDEEKQISHVEVWMNLIPMWAWGLIACVLAVVIESVVVRQMTFNGTVGRTSWALGHLLLGFFGAFGAHVFVFVTFIMRENNAGMLDIVLRPFACWLPTFKKLPSTFTRVAVFAVGVTAVICAFLVLGGFSYDSLLDWGYKKQVKPNLMGAILDQAKNAPGEEEDLEEAIKDFAGESGVDDLEDPKEAPPEPRVDVECVIVGFTTPRDNPEKLSSLILAGAVDGKLKVVGSISGSIPGEVREQLNRKLRTILRKQPFVKSSLRAQWVEPKLTCLLSCKRQTQSGRLIDPQFEDMLAKIE